MSSKTELRLAASRQGRIMIHFICSCQGWRNLSFHVKGIWREVTFQGKKNPFAVHA